MNPLSPLGQEWTTLQNNHEQYERSSLLIKLAAAFFSVLGLLFDIPALYLVAVLLILVIRHIGPIAQTLEEIRNDEPIIPQRGNESSR